MKKKSIISLVLVALFSFMLVACGNKETTTKKPSNNTQKLDAFWDADGNGVADFTEKEITLKYATWQYHEGQTTIDTLLIDSFMQKYPNIHVEMAFVADLSDNFESNLLTLAETGDLPDVFLVNRLETLLPYNILADITDYYNHDSDSAYIFESLQNNGYYDGVRYAVPSFVYPKWWFVNLDVLTANGISKPGYDWTWDQMEAIAQACYDETEHIVGQSGYTHYWQELPKVLSGDSSMASFGFSKATNSFNFDSRAFEQAMQKMTDAIQNHSTTSPFSIAQIEEYYNKTVTEYALNNGYNIGFDGKAAIWNSPSWCAKDYFQSMTFNWDVYPAPGAVVNGEFNQTIGGNTDLIGVASTSREKAAAYQLLKWLSYGEEGLIERYSLYKDYSESLYVSADNYPYPVADYGIEADGANLVWDNLPYTRVPGMTAPELINALKNGAFNLNKETPGWDAVDSVVNPYFYEIANGDNTYQAVKETLNQAATQAFTEFNKALLDRIQNN